MTIPSDLNVYISALMFVVGAYLIALYVGLIVWTFRDIRSRSRDLLAQIMATFLVALFTVPGLLIYLLLRPQETLMEAYERELTEEAIVQELETQRACPNCRHSVEADFIVCPYCHQQLRLRCVGCGRLLNPEWDVCPYCGLLLDEEEEEGSPSEEAPDEQESARETVSVGEPATPSEREADVDVELAGGGELPPQQGDEASEDAEPSNLI
ncbi:MAG: zinc ribbon domain-containing protein [Anaerolineales bacterium]